MEFVFQKAVSLNNIKGGIAKEGIGAEVLGGSKKKSESTGFETEESPIDLSSSGENDFFSYRQFRVCNFKIIVEKCDMADNDESVGEDGELIGIAEMVVDVELFCIKGGSGLRRHESVSHLIRVNIKIIFIIDLET